MPPGPPRPANPSKEIFDPFNSSATGHQRADNRLGGSTSWRESRQLKLNDQLEGGSAGGKRKSDTVGAGSLDFGRDGRKANGGWEDGAKGLRKGGQQSIWESMQGAKVDKEVERPSKRIKSERQSEREPTSVVNPFTPLTRKDGSIRETSWTSHESSPSHQLSVIDSNNLPHPTQDNAIAEGTDSDETKKSKPQIFANLTFYINGSTSPTIGDHKLKHLLSEHGGRVSVALGRRTVTHVIIGRSANDGGYGGGLSGSKLQKEVARMGGSAIKYVTAEWVLESIKEGKRMPESRFKGINIAPKGVAGIAGMLT